MQGWECPVCHVGVAPHMNMCPQCKKRRLTIGVHSDQGTVPARPSVYDVTPTAVTPVTAEQYSEWFPITSDTLPK